MIREGDEENPNEIFVRANKDGDRLNNVPIAGVCSEGNGGVSIL